MLMLTFSVLGAPMPEGSTREIKEERLSAPGAKDEAEKIVSSAIDLAQEYLDRAIEEEESEKMKGIYLRMSRKFQHTTFRIQDSGQGYCSLDWVGDKAKAAIMYVTGNFFGIFGMKNRINVCTIVLLFNDPVSDAAQFIIHELAHIIGISDECQAELIRYSVMELNDLEFVASGYDCSLDTLSALSISNLLSTELYVTARLFH